MPTGSIKKTTDKGFGFITPSEGGEDMFFHMSAVEGTDFNSLQEGMQVNYTVGTNPRDGRPRAEAVTVIA